MEGGNPIFPFHSFISHRLPTVSYVLLYLKSQKFPPKWQNVHGHDGRRVSHYALSPHLFLFLMQITIIKNALSERASAQIILHAIK